MGCGVHGKSIRVLAHISQGAGKSGEGEARKLHAGDRSSFSVRNLEVLLPVNIRLPQLIFLAPIHRRYGAVIRFFTNVTYDDTSSRPVKQRCQGLAKKRRQGCSDTDLQGGG